jgi:Raf kinase inhibitor-like YbhB/YbcL family protein
VNGPAQGNPSPLTVTSPDLAGGTFPREFTCDGANRPPRLQWSTPPSGTQELAVEMLDPDAPGGTFTHWLIYRMPPGITSLAAVLPGAAEGINDFGRRGYGGPCPPRGAAHHYHSVVLALDPGWAWQPERGGRIWTPAQRVTCCAGANWSPPAGACAVLASASEPDSASRSEIPALDQTLITECSQPADGKRV